MYRGRGAVPSKMWVAIDLVWVAYDVFFRVMFVKRLGSRCLFRIPMKANCPNRPTKARNQLKWLIGGSGLPVHADGTQVKDGGGAQHDIHGHQSIAYVGAQRPYATQELHTRHRKK